MVIYVVDSFQAILDNYERCLPEDTLVYMESGRVIPIEKISVGDRLLDGSIVTGVFKRYYEGEMIHIKPRYLEDIYITPDHPILIAYIKGKIFRKRKLIGTRWIYAGDVNKYDYVVIPKYMVEKDTYVSFEPYIKKWERKVKVPREMMVNEEFAELLGWYLAEGISTSKFIEFSLSKEENENINRIVDIVRSLFGYKHKIVNGNRGNSIFLRFDCNILPRAFKDWIGDNAKSKSVPPFIFDARKSIVESFLEGYIKGDGWRTERCGYKEVGIATVSRILARQIQLLLMKLGIMSRFRRERNDDRVLNDGYVIKGGPIYTLRWPETRLSKRYFEDDMFYYVQIDGKEVVKYSGYVYNLETTSGRYYIPFTVHNCRYGTYQLQEIEGGKIILKVRVGSLGYEKTFNSKDDEDLKEKLEILKSRGFYKVIKAVPEDAFFG